MTAAGACPGPADRVVSPEFSGVIAAVHTGVAMQGAPRRGRSGWCR